jgi:hypothetical protein
VQASIAKVSSPVNQALGYVLACAIAIGMQPYAGTKAISLPACCGVPQAVGRTSWSQDNIRSAIAYTLFASTITYNVIPHGAMSGESPRLARHQTASATILVEHEHCYVPGHQSGNTHSNATTTAVQCRSWAGLPFLVD